VKSFFFEVFGQLAAFEGAQRSALGRRGTVEFFLARSSNLTPFSVAQKLVPFARTPHLAGSSGNVCPALPLLVFALNVLFAAGY